MNKVTYWVEEDDLSKQVRFLNNIKSLDHFLFSYLCMEPHAFLHVGTILQKHQSSFENKKVLSIGLDMCKEVILLKANPSRVTVIDIDESKIESARLLANRIIKHEKIEYFVGDAKNLDIKENYDTVLLSQMDYCMDDGDYSSLLAAFKKSGVEEVIILTPSLYELSLRPHKLLETCNFFLGAIRRRIMRGKYSSATFRRAKKYFEKILSENYSIADHFDYKYPSGREHLYRLIKT